MAVKPFSSGRKPPPLPRKFQLLLRRQRLELLPKPLCLNHSNLYKGCFRKDSHLCHFWFSFSSVIIFNISSKVSGQLAP